MTEGYRCGNGKDESLTGADIKLVTLGTVPSATSGSPPYEWVEPEYFDGAAFKGIDVSASATSLGLGFPEATVTNPYRCATVASN